MPTTTCAEVAAALTSDPAFADVPVLTLSPSIGTGAVVDVLVDVLTTYDALMGLGEPERYRTLQAGTPDEWRAAYLRRGPVVFWAQVP